MPPKPGAPKKLGGSAKKAAAAAEKAAQQASLAAAAEDAEWTKGAQGTSKKEAAEAKKRAAADRKKAAAAALAEEEAALPSKPKGAPAKAPKRARGGIDAALNASGLDDALDALDITVGPGGGGGGAGGGVDRHPERRYKAAYAAYEERRLPEVREESKGLRLGQMKELIKKEFEKSPENPFNQGLNVRFDATKEEVEAVKVKQKEKIEERLAEK